MTVLLVAIIGLITSFIANVTGGGGALLLLPVLQLLGVPPLTAVGTIKFGAMGLIIGSLLAPNSRKYVRKDRVWPIIAIVAVASVLGPLLAFSIEEDTVRAISSVLVLTTAAFALFTWNQPAQAKKVTHSSIVVGYTLYFFTTLLLAGFGAGVGILSNLILISFLGMSALQTIGTRRIAGLIGVPIQFIAFGSQGRVDYGLGIVLFLTAVVGGYVGFKFAIKQGNVFVKRAMAVFAIVLVALLFAKG